MAMPSGNAVVGDGKSKFQVAPGAGEIRHGHQPPMWFPDERDGFISWLRGEFAAANAIIDSICHHLRAVGEPGEYDAVIGLIQQRRCNWTSVLHMQQYFPVSEIVYALNQVTWRRQQQQQQPQQHRYFDQSKFGGKEFRRASPGFNKNQGLRGGEAVREAHNSGVEGCTNNGNAVSEKGQESKVAAKPEDAAEDDKAVVTKNLADFSLKSCGNPGQIVCENSKSEVGLTNDGCMSTSKEGEEDIRSQNGKQDSPPVPKTFIGNEMFDGKMVNVVDGMKLYEDVLDDAEVKKLVSLVNDLRAAGKRGQSQAGQTYSVTKRPMKGRGREIIQLGLPIVDAPLEDEKDRRIEAIPALLQGVIERIVGMNITTLKPDSCIIDFYNEGDHSQPCSWPCWFGHPICLLSLTECDLTFGRVIAIENPGNFRGSLRLSLSPGSLLAMQGKSADFAKYALPSLRKQRILITFTKSQPKKSIPIDSQHHIPSPAIIQSSHRSPTTNKPLNHGHVRHPAGSKYYGSVPPKNVMPAPPIIPTLNGMQPLLVAAPSMPFPTPVPIPAPSATGWAAPPPRHPPPPHPNVPGTGVFLPPPGPGSPSPDQLPPSTTTDHDPNVERGLEKENGLEKSNQVNPECNGNIDGGKTMAKERT
ncbi:RNA demethylase ALKBH10B isoform X2 [Punica granatum]|uniref:RNA demethylase ALKBH10B isoform X2 n=1 Tax=Punica granatum TaxID=22663 RepID=A0A6P8E4E6_PUNGR|nr:RNA demethylase ALKBH10B isoform X2 [Punica granatum]